MNIKQRSPKFKVKMPYDLSFMRMHGHTKIELFDGLTGKLKERVEDDNMFTNAIPKMINFALNHNYIQYIESGQTNALGKLLNSHLDLVGGLALIDTALDSDADHFYIPSGAKLTACGALSKVNGDASIPILGSYNSAESTSDTLMRSWVWDFATNQGNGTISTACLTSKYGGYVHVGGAPTLMGNNQLLAQNRALIGLGNIVDRSRYGRDSDNDSYNRATTNGGYRDFCIDGDNDLKYMVRFRSDGFDILSHKMTPENFDLFRAVTGLQSATVESYSANLASPYYWFFYNTHEKALYFWGWSNTNPYMTTNQSVTINRFDMTTKTLTTSYDSFTDTLADAQNIYFQSFCVTENGVYMTKPSYNGYFKHTRGGGSGITAVPLTGVNYTVGYNNISFVLNNILYMGLTVRPTSSGSYDRGVAIDLADDSVRFLGCVFSIPTRSGVQARLVPPIDNNQIVFGTGQPMNASMDSGSYVWNLEMETSSYYGRTNTFALTSYLATKNVLSSPVTKTSDKTMKVTYTITGEELS